MSVVNDVLKNLDERKSIETSSGLNSMYFQHTNEHSKWVWVGLGVSITTCSILLILLMNPTMFEFRSNTNHLVIPNDIFLLNDDVMPKETNKNLRQQTDAMPISTAEIIQNPIKENVSLPKSINNIVKETPESKATEKVVTAIQKGDINGVKSTFSDASKSIQNEVQLRLLLKESPHLVWLKIKQQHPNYLSKPRLLALSAQGQQRAGDHISAVNLYKKLIPLAPDDGRWRAGLAISLESLGEVESAKKLYQLALGMNELPFSLKRFIQHRLESLKN